MNMRKYWPTVFALAFGLWAGVRNLLFADDRAATEMGGGIVTGPMINLSLVGSLILLAGVVIQLRRRRVGGILSLVGLGLMLPLFSWYFANGVWCSQDTCGVELPPFSFHSFSAITLLLASASITLQWWPRRP